MTLATALASERTRAVRGDIAMTGEITLSGRVLPVNLATVEALYWLYGRQSQRR